MSQCTISHSRAGGRPGTYWSSCLLPRSAPTCISDLILGTNPGDLVCFFSEHSTSVPSTRNGMQRPPLALLWAWWGGYRLSLLWGLNDLPTSTLWLAWVLPVAGKATCLVPSPAFAQLLRLLRPQTARSWRRYGSSLLWGNRLRFPVRWKALKICQRVVIEPYVLSGWLPAGDGEGPWRDITRSITFTVHVTNKRRHSSGQISSRSGMPAPFWTVKQTLFPMASVVGAALIKGYTLVQNLSTCMSNTRCGLFIWVDRGTCLFTLGRHGLSVNGGCQRLQLALPPHLALLTAGRSDWWPPGIGPPGTSWKERWFDIVKKSDLMTLVTIGPGLHSGFTHTSDLMVDWALLPLSTWNLRS